MEIIIVYFKDQIWLTKKLTYHAEKLLREKGFTITRREFNTKRSINLAEAKMMKLITEI